ncbi:hypothetical protein AB0M20_31300 [Actinoplanes sp. NPDC051633]|uniref:DUF6197 family protein n=1 Tax=Actinoplanes sp. NPDC051633 TaxID=3155670 RepID=UPI00343FFEC6
MHRTQNPTAPASDTDGLAAVTPADILRGAARYLDLHGWTQELYYSGGPEDAFPPACVDGAIGMAAYGRVTMIPGDETDNPGFRDYNLAATYFNGYLADSGAYANPDEPYPFHWNDDSARTKAEVITALRAAADEYDWQHATEEQLETYAEMAYANETVPTREGFLAWLGAR